MIANSDGLIEYTHTTVKCSGCQFRKMSLLGWFDWPKKRHFVKFYCGLYFMDWLSLQIPSSGAIHHFLPNSIFVRFFTMPILKHSIESIQHNLIIGLIFQSSEDYHTRYDFESFMVSLPKIVIKMQDTLFQFLKELQGSPLDYSMS